MTGKLIISERGCFVVCEDGYISKNGGLTKRVDKAQRFSGPGYAIRIAQCYAIAITEWSDTRWGYYA